MAHTLTDASTFTPLITVPDDGDTASAASIELQAQGITDRTRYLADRDVTLTGGDLYIPFIQGYEWPTDAAECFTAVQKSYYTQSSVANYLQSLGIRLNGVRDGASVASVSVIVNGGQAGVHSALPVGKAHLFAHSVSHTTVSSTSIGPLVNDPSVDVAAYEVTHTITCPLTVPYIVDNAASHFRATFRGEGSTNALDDALVLLACYVTFNSIL